MRTSHTYENEQMMLREVRKFFRGYAKTKEWKLRRERFLVDKSICESCGESLTHKNTVVHHLSYEHILNELDNELMALCIKCHSAIHDIQKKAKLPIIVATAEVVGERIQDLYQRVYGKSEGRSMFRSFMISKKRNHIIPSEPKKENRRRIVSDSVARWESKKNLKKRNKKKS
jgi:hypothetical protein